MIAKSHCQKGFTLVEILVALAVATIALGALIRLVGSNAYTSNRVESRLFGHWVAMNQMAEIEARNLWLATGKKADKVEMAGREFRWERLVQNTPDPNVRYVTFKVFDQNDDQVAALSGFSGRIRVQSQ